MNILKSQKKEAPKPLVPIVSHFKVPYYRKMRGKRFNARGEFIGPAGPRKPVPDVRDRENLRRAARAAALLPKPEDSDGFDLRVCRLMSGKVLVKRPPPITEEKG